MTNSFRIIPYLRWLKASWRRIREDAQGHVYRQRWWAKGVSIAPSALIRLGANARLEIGHGSLIGPYTILDAQSDPMGDQSIMSILTIGEHTAINEFNNIRAAGGEIAIGSACIISQFVSIIAANHSFALGQLIRNQAGETTRNWVHIGDDVWIGVGAIILPGVTIGTGSVIAAGAVVTSDIPEYAVAAGVPARVIRVRQ